MIVSNTSQLLSILLLALRAVQQNKQKRMTESLIAEHVEKELNLLNNKILVDKEKLQAKLQANQYDL